jgi:hypothetical protein
MLSRGNSWKTSIELETKLDLLTQRLKNLEHLSQQMMEKMINEFADLK